MALQVTSLQVTHLLVADAASVRPIALTHLSAKLLNGCKAPTRQARIVLTKRRVARCQLGRKNRQKFQKHFDDAP